MACHPKDWEEWIEAAIACPDCIRKHDCVFAPHPPDDRPDFSPPDRDYSDGSDDTD